MSAQQFRLWGIWQDVRLYLAEAPDSHDKSIKLMVSLLTICLLSHLPTTLGAVAAQNNRQSPTLCRLKLVRAQPVRAANSCTDLLGDVCLVLLCHPDVLRNSHFVRALYSPFIEDQFLTCCCRAEFLSRVRYFFRD